MVRITPMLLMAGALTFVTACATYYHTQADFNREFERGDRAVSIVLSTHCRVETDMSTVATNSFTSLTTAWSCP